MGCCCNKVLHLCRVKICGSDYIKTGVNAPSPGGIYTLVLDFLGTELTIIANIATGQEIKFPSAGLNEKYTFTGFIKDPTGARATITIDDVVYDCISFQTGLSYQINELGSD